jgi:hypothetical protein
MRNAIITIFDAKRMITVRKTHFPSLFYFVVAIQVGFLKRFGGL